MRTKLKLAMPLGLTVGLFGLLLTTAPSLIGSAATLFGWARCPEELSLVVVALGLVLALFGLALTLRGLLKAAKADTSSEADPTRRAP
ncbi:hypothetical protein [Brevundimonas vesicularis]|uniref:Uncharacterized protein n=1 Tax=Brevundimonas vesicularis TaxID=41276 RepID=A0A1Z3UAX6_BREVE|nr:hypothetical protein [Brevundimonas vesicularis]ASE40144.1 hypothetical protein CEP68_11860 [Brevundimonas vesicularis]MDX2334149.1 hypothetical protein [Brevundimonas vesicularis]